MSRKNRCIRFDDEEWERLAQLAKDAGMTRSHFIRTRALRPLRAPRVQSDLDQEIVRQLARIGNNLNQLTRAVHNDRPEYQDLKRVFGQLEKALESFL
jgi:hypothetical protein